MTRSNFNAFVTLLLGSTVWTSSAFAQADPTAASTTAEAPQDGITTAGNDIVVTANKRSERLQAVPAAISALTSEGLDKIGAHTLADFGRTVPGLFVAPSQFGGAGTPTLRGIASGTGEATVGYYVDDSPLQIRPSGFGSAADLKLFDVSRVEVLRGPQGTLYGASSMGGTIRYVMEQPSLTEFSGRGRAELAGVKGGDLNYEAAGAVGGPIISDTVGFRASAYYRRDGGWIDRVSRTTGAQIDDNVNEQKSIALRGALLIQPTSNLSITPSIYYQRTKLDDLSFFDPQLPGRYTIQTNQRQPGTDRFVLAGLRANLDLGFANLTSITSNFDRKNGQDMDYSQFVAGIDARRAIVPGLEDLRATGIFSTKQKIFSQEVRLSSSGAGRLNYTIGGFYINDRYRRLQDVPFPDAERLARAINGNSFAQNHRGIGLLPGDSVFHGDTAYKRTAYSAFGEATWEIVDHLKITGGVRFEHSKLELDRLATGAFQGGTLVVTGRTKESPVTGKANVSYEITRNNLVFGSWSQGFRTGGVNRAVPTVGACATDLAAIGASGAPTTFDSDRLDSFEVGTKNSFEGGRFTVNASAYLINWKNIQQDIALSCGYSFTTNLGEARSKGVELELTARPITGLTLTGTGSYNHAVASTGSFGGVVAATGQRSVIALKGDRITGVPDWNLAGSAEYRWEPAEQLEAYLRVDYQYVGSLHRSAPPGRVGYIAKIFDADSYDYASLRIGAVTGQGVDVSLFVNNIFDSRPLIGRFTLLDPTATIVPATSLAPRTIGLTASASFR